MRKKIFQAVLLCSIAIGIACACSTTFRRMLWYNFADVHDYEIFAAAPLQASSAPYHIPQSTSKHKLDKLSLPCNLNQYLQENNTLAFLVIKNDSIIYQNYFDNYDSSSIVPSFSMAKSITSMLVSCALSDGYIKSNAEPITNYIPELKKNGFEKVSVQHVMDMCSGIAFNESYYNPTGEAAQFYYGTNLTKACCNLKLSSAPHEQFDYVSGNTQLLKLVLHRALKGKRITTYLQEKLWTPLGMQYDASWSLDKEQGLEKTFCCINARAQDYAKIGLLMLHNGKWQGKQLLDSNYVAACYISDTTTQHISFYKNQWWIPSTNHDLMAKGILGQFIYISPAKQIVIVRLGRNYGNVEWEDFLMQCAAVN